MTRLDREGATTTYAAAFFAVALTLLVSAAHAEALPYWTPAELARHSDLIVVGSQKADTLIAIRKVLKGKWDRNTVDVPDLSEYRKKPTSPLVGTVKELEVSDNLLVFLDLRWGRPKVVAHGVYRVDRIEGAEVTTDTFVPKYAVELSTSGPISALRTARRTLRRNIRQPRP